VFGRDGVTPFDDSSADARVRKAWRDANLEPLTLHEARHTFASLMIAAGVNAKALATYMGHSSVTITYDRYGHLMPGNEPEAADRLEAHLENSRRATVFSLFGRFAAVLERRSGSPAGRPRGLSRIPAKAPFWLE
jgi:integrase-like protein